MCLVVFGEHLVSYFTWHTSFSSRGVYSFSQSFPFHCV